MHQLYKRLLLTLFPDEMKQADINPATMFISSLSTKEFFSLLSRKVTEYYKTNGFDTGIETFEAKIGLGTEQGITVNKANDYYGYLIAAQYTGKSFFSPSFVSTHLSLYSATVLAPHMDVSQSGHFVHTIVMIYLMPYFFLTHIKRFPPQMQEKDRYNWFVELCLEVLQYIMEDEDEDAIHHINGILHHESTVIRNLYIICQRAAGIFPLGDDITAYREWMLDPHLFNHEDKSIAQFLKHYEKQSIRLTLDNSEEEVMTMLFPHDFSIRSLYDEVDIRDVVKSILTPWYNSQVSLQQAWEELDGNPSAWEIILRSFSEMTHEKTVFWSGVQDFILSHRAKQAIDIHEDIDEFMSAIQDGGNVDMDIVPESIKRESRVVDQIIHFYIGIVGSHRSSKSDNFRYRWTQGGGCDRFPSSRGSLDETTHSYRQDHMTLYDTNGFYYQRARDHIRQGKQKFHIPLRAALQYRTRDTYTRDALVESALMHLMSEARPSRMRLTIHQHHIVTVFGEQYANRIRDRIADEQLLIRHHRDLIDRRTGAPRSKTILSLIGHDSDNEQLTHLRESLYRLDRWVRHDVISSILADDELLSLLHSIYDDRVLLVLMSELKKTLFGVMLRVQYEQEHHTTSYGTLLWQLYLTEILHVESLLSDPIVSILQDHHARLQPLLSLWLQIDDNDAFLKLCSSMWHDFQHSKRQHLHAEDILWLHSTFHHISSYNTRYLIPD